MFNHDSKMEFRLATHLVYPDLVRTVRTYILRIIGAKIGSGAKIVSGVELVEFLIMQCNCGWKFEHPAMKFSVCCPSCGRTESLMAIRYF